jgi:hypothetical protein
VGTIINQGVRVIEVGHVRGDSIIGEPTIDAPIGYWITVARPGELTAS